MPAAASSPPVAPRRWPFWGSVIALAAALLGGCASGPPAGRDGPEPNPPPDLMQVPDAEPRLEPIRLGGPNRPYEVLGQSYTPITADGPFTQRGLASWYGKKFHGRSTASGETYNMYAMTAAHPTLPIPSYARVRNPANGREVIVRINDRGPFHPGRVIDLSYTAALKLGVLGGVAPVEVVRLTSDEIVAGTWRRAPAPEAPATAVAQAPREQVVAVPAAGTVPVVAIPTDAAAAASPPVSATPNETARAAVPGAAGFWVQLGAFKERDGAVGFQQKVGRELAAMAPMLAIFNEHSMHRLQAGPYANREDAARAAQQVRDALQLVPVIVERR